MTACNPAKNPSYRARAGNVEGAVQGKDATPAPVKDLSLVLSNSKLTALGGTLTARMTYNGVTFSKDFSPSGSQSKLEALALPPGSGRLLTVEILQGNAVKFIAKRANTSIEPSSSIVIDDCLILSAPWQGTANDGSCEWSISEVN